MQSTIETLGTKQPITYPISQLAILNEYGVKKPRSRHGKTAVSIILIPKRFN